MKDLFLKKIHEANGAKFIEFAGYNMPIMYQEGIIKEHMHTRDSASFFDVSHMGQIFLHGKDVFDFLDILLPIVSRKIGVQRAKYTLMLNNKGGIIDDLIITKVDEDKFLLVLNAACMEKDIAHIRTHMANFSNLRLDILDDKILGALQGPKAWEVLTDLFPNDNIRDIAFMSGKNCTLNLSNNANVWINRGGYTGEDGFELYANYSCANELVLRMLNDERVRLAGLGARNSLRIEAGLSLYGNDIDEQTNAFEADLSFAISKKRLENEEGGVEFIGQAASQKAKKQISRKKIGIVSTDKAPLREGVPIYAHNSKEEATDDNCIGSICSGTFSPSLKKPIAFAYVNIEHTEPHTKLWAKLRERMIEIHVTSLPFVSHKYKK